MRLEDLVVIDIETVAEYPDYESMPEAWRGLWEEKVSRVLPEGTGTAAFYPLRAGVMAEFAKIICICVGVFMKEIKLELEVRSFYADDERRLLSDFITVLNSMQRLNPKCCFGGHNIREFDIPFICRRLIINDIPIPEWLDFQNRKPWDIQIMDSFQFWRFGDYKNYTSLNLLAAALGVPSSKTDIDGSKVGGLYWAGDKVEKENNLSRIVSYCRQDVVTTANILLRLQHMPIVQEHDVIIVPGAS